VHFRRNLKFYEMLRNFARMGHADRISMIKTARSIQNIIEVKEKDCGGVEGAQVKVVEIENVGVGDKRLFAHPMRQQQHTKCDIVSRKPQKSDQPELKF